MKKNNIPLILGMLIPVFMIIFVAVSIYLPALFTQPKYDFLYAAGGDYYLLNSYAVQNSKLIKNEVNYPANYLNSSGLPKAEPKLYVYDMAKNVSREVSFEEAQRLKLNSENISPDGFEVVSGTEDFSIFSIFFSRGDFYGAKYIRGHGISKRLNLHKENDYWYHNIRFIGWLIQ